MAMTEDEKINAAKKMIKKEKDMIMRTAAEQNTTIDETITMNINQSIPNRGLIVIL